MVLRTPLFISVPFLTFKSAFISNSAFHFIFLFCFILLFPEWWCLLHCIYGGSHGCHPLWAPNMSLSLLNGECRIFGDLVYCSTLVLCMQLIINRGTLTQAVLRKGLMWSSIDWLSPMRTYLMGKKTHVIYYIVFITKVDFMAIHINLYLYIKERETLIT